jgi:AraC-like DNA-binding protein
MEDNYRNRVKNFSTWHRYGLQERSPIEVRMPVIESSIIQVAPGPSDTGATIVSDEDVTVVHSLIHPHSVGALVLKSGYTGFYYPRHWVGDLTVNGVLATPGTIHLPVDNTYYVHGKERDIVGCILPRTRFIETVAALRGVDPGQVMLHGRALELPPSASRQVRKGLESIIDTGLACDVDSTSNCSSLDLTNAVFELMADMYLYVRPEVMRKSGHVRNPGRIVRAAEERFAEAMGNPISLADLCAATGVSKSVLYLAFQNWCGEPPISYFHKRRLSKVRSRLLNTEHRRGAVKQAALSVGLTELGRFSREYRQLFGEQPSITLSSSVVA